MGNKKGLFYASCVALTVTSMTFAIRAGILNELKVDFGLQDAQLGWVNGMASFGFPIAMLLLGLAYNTVGPKKLMIIAFGCHLLGLIMTIFSGGFWGLILSTFAIGFANGSVEAACNPMIADMYPDNKTTMLNKFHVWFPGGLVIGSLISYFLEDSLGWQLLIATMLVPTIIYGIMIFRLDFPKTQNLESNTKENIKAIMSSPLFWFMGILMTLTATTELGTTQWIERIIKNDGVHPMIVLAMITGLMAIGRYFAGPLVKKFNPIGVLLLSAVISAIGLVLLSQVSGGMVYFAAMVFAIGVTYFWPTMIGFIGENLPRTGALGMSLIGGFGMFGLTIWNPIIGNWLDTERQLAIDMGQTLEAAELTAGKATLDNIAVFPAILILAFGLLFFIMKKKETES
ncbi:MAG: MFS transporter [Saprospiraceae bacterium]|nr:MFS transporter [Bacteroidia bacterium]NNE13709.1 MFS transporter [Saprospiraceae bacterium]NNL90980.1 MFS transporter [Saprospiraceae bacterium]